MLTRRGDDTPRTGRYRILVGVNLAALDEELEALAEDEPEMTLREAFFAAGTGFIAILELEHEHEHAQEPEHDRPPRRYREQVVEGAEETDDRPRKKTRGKS